MKLIATIAAISAGLILGAMGIVIYFVYPSTLSAEAQAWVRENTGRALAVNGASRVSLWPEAVIRLENVSLAAPETMARAPLMSARELRIKTSLAAILGKRLEIAGISLVEPDFNLLNDAAGNANWMLEKTADLPSIVLENGSLTYLDERTGQTANATEINAVMETNAQDRTIDIDGALVWNRRPVKLTAYIRAPERLLTEGAPVSIALQAPDVIANFDGRMGFAKGLGLAGQIHVSTAAFPNLAEWVSLTSLGHLGIENLNVSGSADISRQQFAISRAEFTVNGAEAIGDVALKLDGSIPVLHASVVTDVVKLDDYFSGGFTIDDLRRLPANLRIAAKNWSAGPIRTGAADVYAKINDGVLEARSQDIEIYGGLASLEATLDSSQTLPSLKLNFNATGLDSYTFLMQWLGRAAASGRADIAGDVLASGKSFPELVSTLGGRIKISARNGTVKGPDLPRLLTDVSRNMVEGWSGGSTPFDEFAATFSLKDGIAETADLSLSGKDISLTGKGEADLLRHAIEFKIDPKFAAGAKAASLPVPLVVKGSWYKPKFYPDMPGILENPDAAYKALKQLGAPAVTESN